MRGSGQMNERQGEDHDQERAHPLEPAPQNDGAVVAVSELGQLSDAGIDRRSWIDEERADQCHRPNNPADRGQKTKLISCHLLPGVADAGWIVVDHTDYADSSWRRRLSSWARQFDVLACAPGSAN